MTIPAPWDTLVEQAQAALDSATLALAEANRAALAAQQQADTLAAYRDEYLASFSQGRSQGLTISALANRQHFINKLDAAWNQQSALCTHAEQRCETARKAWLEAHRRLNAYRTLLERRAHDAALRQARREQGLADEQALQTLRTRDLPLL